MNVVLLEPEIPQNTGNMEEHVVPQAQSCIL